MHIYISCNRTLKIHKFVSTHFQCVFASKYYFPGNYKLTIYPYLKSIWWEKFLWAVKSIRFGRLKEQVVWSIDFGIGLFFEHIRVSRNQCQRSRRYWVVGNKMFLIPGLLLACIDSYQSNSEMEASPKQYWQGRLAQASRSHCLEWYSNLVPFTPQNSFVFHLRKPFCSNFSPISSYIVLRSYQYEIAACAYNLFKLICKQR